MRDELTDHLKNKNYNLIGYDEDDDFSEFDTDQRRAWVLDKYLNRELKGMNKKETAKKFNVRRKQLYKDINIIKLWLRENPQDLVDDTIKVQKQVINKLMESGRWNKAGKRNENMLDVLQDSGTIDKQPDKVEVEKETTVKEIGFNTVNEIDTDKEETEEEN